MNDVLAELFSVIESRKGEDAATSYVASLHEKGLNKILEKIGEETTEVILAAKDSIKEGENTDVVKEVADLWFHSMVMLSHLDLDQAQVQAELANRFGTSGLIEKANRH